jgi:competence protein ComEA
VSLFRWVFTLSLIVVFSLAVSAATVDINTATEQELVSLPGIGPARAHAIVQYRAEHGPFTGLDELDEVPGIGPGTISNLRGLVTFDVSGAQIAEMVSPEAAAPVTGRIDINTATREQLISLPGIGPSRAQAIITFREQNGPFTSVDDLERVQGVGAATLANLRPLITVSAPGSSARPASPETP